MPEGATDFPLDPRRPPELIAYVDELTRAYANGGVMTASFSVPYSQIVHRHPVRYFLRGLFAAPSVRQALAPAVAPPEGVDEDAFEMVDALCIEGRFAATLASGGAYLKPDMSHTKVKAMASGVCAAWFGDRYEDVDAWISHKAWCEFFGNIAWDFTCVVVDNRERRVHVLCATDSD